MKNNTPADSYDREKKSSFVGVALALMLAGAAFFSGLHIGSDARLEASIFSAFSNSTPPSEVDLGTFWQVWNTLEDRFVHASTSEEVTDEDRVWAAAEGLVKAYGDPYTTFLVPEDAEIFEEDISGNFEGVGMEIGLNETGDITVISPLPNTPAEKAGLLPGDVIVAIDGNFTNEMTIDGAVKHIRGEKGSIVTITVLREDVAEPLEIDVVRDTINIPTVVTSVRGNTFIIQLFNFSAVAEAKFQEALREFARGGHTKLIIDVRGNPGGYLDSAVNIASYFLATGKVVVREDFGDSAQERLYRSSGRDLRHFAPEKLVVLVNGGSASASEILAGALQEHGVATVIGSQTFGKGSVQELVDFRDGSSLKVTVARWLTPEGTSISQGGLTPDIVVEMTPEDREAGRDPQLEAALEFLNDQ